MTPWRVKIAVKWPGAGAAGTEREQAQKDICRAREAGASASPAGPLSTLVPWAEATRGPGSGPASGWEGSLKGLDGPLLTM